MAKFSSKIPARKISSPVKTTGKRLNTYEGGVAWSRNAKSDLFLLAVTNMVSEKTFYESGKNRDDRFRQLIHQVAAEDRNWLAGFIPFLRNEMNMRSASIVVAAEAVAAGVERGRELVNLAMSRADEPAEMVGYWYSQYGTTMPKPIKRGIADAISRLYTEKAAIKYDGQSRAIRMADVINLVHPTPHDEQSKLFRYLLDKRYGNVKSQYNLSTIDTMLELESLPNDKLRARLLKNPLLLKQAGYTWERLSGLGAMDKAAWEAVIPAMGYMALLRNLRNFEQAGVSKSVLNGVSAKLSDPDEVAKSRQFPYRMLSAYLATGTTTFSHALETALDLSTQNIPEFNGETLVLVDTSGSMATSVSAKSSVQRAQIGYLFGAAVAKKSKATLVQFASTSKVVPLKKGTSVLRLLERIDYGEVGHGTDMWGAVQKHKTPAHKRVVIFSDMQTTNGYYGVHTRSDVPLYGFNLAGYAPAAFEAGSNNLHEIGGFSDAAFKMISLLERGRSARWPWE